MNSRSGNGVSKAAPREIVSDAPDQRPGGLKVIDVDARVSLPREGISLDAVETSLLKQALAQASGNQRRAADLLGLTRDQFRYRLKKIRDKESGQRQSAPGAAMHG